MSDKRISQLAVKVRNNSPEFDGRESIDDVVEALLEERLTELREGRQKAEDKQAALRQKMGLADDSSDSDGPQSDVEAKQADLRERMSK